MFATNVGTADRVLRLIAGAAVITFGIMCSNWLGIVGVVLVGTAVLRCYS